MRDNDGILMSVTLIAVSARCNPTTNNVSYKLQIAYPQAFDEYLKALLVGAMDIYWDDNLIGQSAVINHMTQKPQKDTDPLFVVVFDLDGGDSTRYNMAAATNTPNGELRLVPTQMALFPKS